MGSNPTLSANFCGLSEEDGGAHDALFTPRSALGDGAEVGTPESVLQGWQPILSLSRAGLFVIFRLASDDLSRQALGFVVKPAAKMLFGERHARRRVGVREYDVA